MRLYLTALAGLSMALAAVPTGGGASAQQAQPFFAGKTIRVVTPTGPGGTVALYSQLVTRYLRPHLAGGPALVVQFMPGAGGVAAATYMMSAAKDGTFIGQIHSSSVHAPLLEAASFDPTQFNWLGSITPMYGVVSILNTAPAITLEQLRTVSVPLAASSRTNESSIIPELINKLLGTKFKIVTGYRGGGDMFLAMENGEAFGRVASWDSWTSEKPDWLRDGRLVHLVQYGPLNTEIPDVPSLSKLLDGENDRRLLEFLGMGMTLGRAFYMPPGNNGAPQKELEAAFAQMLKDTSFVEGAKSLRMAVEPRSGAEISEALKRAYNVTPGVLNALKQLIAN